MGTGIMLDSRRKIGPKGKFRPFILYASFPVTLLAIANFIGTPFDVTGKTVMATILFMLYGLFFSMMNCSYGAMVPAITKNPNERASLAAWRQGGATLGLLLCTVGFVPVMNLIEGNQQLGYIFAATIECEDLRAMAPLMGISLKELQADYGTKGFYGEKRIMLYGNGERESLGPYFGKEEDGEIIQFLLSLVLDSFDEIDDPVKLES